MIRQFLTLILIPTVLANPGTCLAHFHHAGQPADHDATPHVHVGANASSADHHHDDDDDDDLAFVAFAPGTDHDADAVYHPSGVMEAPRHSASGRCAASGIEVGGPPALIEFDVLGLRFSWCRPPPTEV